MPPRFDASQIAFHSLSRRLGESWTAPYFRRTLVALGDDPEARRTFASLCGARALNLIVGPFGEGRENRGFLSWNPLFVPAPVRALPPLQQSPQEHARWIVGFARRAGALAAGVAALNQDWVYERVQLNPYAAEAPQTKAVEFAQVAAPRETEEALEIPEGVNRAIVLLVPLDRRELQSDAFSASGIETSLGYSRMGALVLAVAEAIRGAGYTALPCMNDTALSVPLAVDAGLGVAGRHGMLIAAGVGPAVRIAKVLTDLPAAPAEPAPAALATQCKDCGLCAAACPVGAIPRGEPTAEASHLCNNPGVLKWPVDGEACLGHWIDTGASCARCQAACPLR